MWIIIIQKVLSQETKSTCFGLKATKRRCCIFFLLLFAFKVTKAGRLSFTMSTNHMGVSVSAESDSVGLGGTAFQTKSWTILWLLVHGPHFE